MADTEETSDIEADLPPLCLREDSGLFRPRTWRYWLVQSNESTATMR